MAETDLELVRRGFDLFASGHADFAELAHPDIEVQPLSQNLLTADTTYRGVEEVTRWARELVELGFKVSVEDMREESGHVIVTGLIVADHPDRPRAAARAAWLVTCDGGAIRRIRTFHGEDQAIRAATVEG